MEWAAHSDSRQAKKLELYTEHIVERHAANANK